MPSCAVVLHMAETEHPLLQLSPEKQSQLVDLVENGEIDAISEATGLSRRQILQVGAALGVGSVAGGLSASELVRKVRADASTSDGDGNVGLPGDRVDVFAEGVDANSVNTDIAYTISQTVFVRTDGDDTNDGLSTSEPKATIQAAVDDAPIPGSGGLVEIDVGSGTFSSGVQIAENVAADGVVINGSTDGSGNPDAVIDLGGASGSCITTDGKTVFVNDMVLKNAGYTNVRVGHGGKCELDNVDLVEGGQFNALATAEAFLKYRSGKAELVSGAGSGSNVESISSTLVLNDNVTVLGSGGLGVVTVKQNSYALIGAATIDGDSGATCLYISDGSDVKLNNGTAFQNADNGVIAVRSSDVTDKSSTGVSFSSVTDPWTTKGASYAQVSSANEEIWSPPTGDPASVNSFGMDGGSLAVYYDKSVPAYRVYEPFSDRHLNVGRFKVDEGTVTVPAGGTATVTTPLGNSSLDVSYGPAQAVSAEVTYRVGHDVSNAIVVFEETTGNNDIDINYTIYNE